MANKTHPLYRVWTGMRARCNQPNNSSYPNYGAKGITVCDRWDDFNAFVEDMGERPLNCTLDRIDSTKGYTPSNCRWSDRHTQNCNRDFGGTGCIMIKDNGRYQVSLGIFGKRHQQTVSSFDEAELLLAALICERNIYKNLGYYA